jgi:hypothetical protein
LTVCAQGERLNRPLGGLIEHPEDEPDPPPTRQEPGVRPPSAPSEPEDQEPEEEAPDTPAEPEAQ